MGFGNLGIALGSGVDEYNNQRKLAREDETLAMQKAAEARQAEQFGWQRDDQKRKSEIQQRQDAVMRAAQANAGFLRELDSLPDDKLGEFTGRVSQHYNQDPAWANGMYANMTTVEGKPYVVHGNMAKLGGVQMIPVTRDGIRGALGQMNDDLQRRLALAGGAETYMPYASEQQKLALQGREVGAKERSNEITDKHYQRSDATNDAYKTIMGQYYQGKLSLEQAQLGIERLKANATINAARMGSPITMYDDAGNPAFAIPTYSKAGGLPQLNVISAPQGYSFTPKASGAKGANAMPQMTVADYAKLEELADARASLLARDPANKNQKPTFLRDVAKEQILSEMGYGTSVKGVQGRGAPGSLGNPYAANATARGASPYPEEAPMSADAWTEPDLSALYVPTRGGVAPGGFYGSRPAAPVVQEAAPRPNAFYPSGGVGLVDLGIPRRQR